MLKALILLLINMEGTIADKTLLFRLHFLETGLLKDATRPSPFVGLYRCNITDTSADLATL